MNCPGQTGKSGTNMESEIFNGCEAIAIDSLVPIFQP